MKSLCLLALFISAGLAQRGAPPPLPSGAPLPDEPSAATLPNGKLQHDEIAKADYKHNLEDAAQLLKLATELKADLDKETAFVVSVKEIKKTEDIEKLARGIRGRMKRY